MVGNSARCCQLDAGILRHPDIPRDVVDAGGSRNDCQFRVGFWAVWCTLPVRDAGIAVPAKWDSVADRILVGPGVKKGDDCLGNGTGSGDVESISQADVVDAALEGVTEEALNPWPNVLLGSGRSDWMRAKLAARIISHPAENLSSATASIRAAVGQSRA